MLQTICGYSLPLFMTMAALATRNCEPETQPFPPEDVARFEQALQQTQAQQRAVGITMAVQSGDGHRWAGTAGLADIAENRPVTEDTLFRTASIPKTFTGALILSLHEEGRLSVDDPISDYVDLVPNGDRITLRMLLQHTSGIANYTKVPAYREAVERDPLHQFTYEELVAFAVEHGPQFPPGERWDYCNTGYILLGIIAESIVERPLFEEIRARYFRRLGMNDTRPIGETLPDGLWSGYELTEDGPIPATFTANYPADGGYATSLDDMLTWARAFFGGELHRPETIEMARVTSDGGPLDQFARSFGFDTAGYGLGFFGAAGDPFGTLFAGAGNADGVRSFVGYLPEHRLAFVVSVNVGDRNAPIIQSIGVAGPLLQALHGTITTDP